MNTEKTVTTSTIYNLTKGVDVSGLGWDWSGGGNRGPLSVETTCNRCSWRDMVAITGTMDVVVPVY